MPNHQNLTIKSLSASTQRHRMQRCLQKGKINDIQHLKRHQSSRTRCRTPTSTNCIFNHLKTIQALAADLANMTNTPNQTSVFLDSSEKWTDWEHRFINKAEGLGLWETIKDPSLDFLQEPRNPGMRPNLQGAVIRVNEPIYQTALAILKIECDEYHHTYGKYKEQKINIERLKDWVLVIVPQ
jgi:hypothetical protein